MKKNLKNYRITVFVCLVISLSILTTNAFAVTSSGLIEVGLSICGNYDDVDCGYGSRVTLIYGDRFVDEITHDPLFGDPVAEETFYWEDSASYTNDFYSKEEHSINHDNVDDVDLMVYSGHGLQNQSYTNGNAFHNMSGNGNINSHINNETHSDLHMGTDDASFGKGSNSKVKWLVAYTCNFLNSSSDPYLASMMEGLHLCMGYNSKVWIVANEGKDFGKSLRDGDAIKDAWFDAARNNQPTGSGYSTKYPRVLGADISRNDTIFNYSSKPNAFGTGEQYYYWTITIS
jgi:hypothetical protein